jgi:hypothetical protein
MFTSLTCKLLPFFVAITLMMTLMGTFIARTAVAKILVNTIDPVATVADDGRHLVVTGPVACTAGERAHLRVTVTQRDTGAVAQGHTFIRCNGDTQQWKVHAATQGKEPFQAGAATAVALDRTTRLGDPTDAHQWLVEITLVEE